MQTITIEEAQVRLPDLIQHLSPGEEILITRDARPVAKLVGQPETAPHPVFGRGQGKLIVVSEDDEHLKDFEEYMPFGISRGKIIEKAFGKAPSAQ